MHVVFLYNNGKTAQMTERYAKVLAKLGRGTYSELDTEKKPSNELPEVEQLRAEAEKRGIAYHHRAGIAKLRELLGE
jgi:hypothetical protein